MRFFLLIAVVGLAAQAFAEAPIVHTPTTQYAAAAEVEHQQLPSAYNVQSGYEGYLVPNTHQEAAYEVAETEEEQEEGGVTGFISKLLNGAPVDAISSLLGVAGLDNILEDNKLTLVGAHGKPVVIPLPFGKHGKGKLTKLKSKKHLKKLVVAKILTKLVVNVVGFALLFFVVAGVGASVCAFTPLCAITFPVAREMRSLATTSNLNMLSNLVMQAVDKFQDMQ